MIGRESMVAAKVAMRSAAYPVEWTSGSPDPDYNLHFLFKLPKEATCQTNRACRLHLIGIVGIVSHNVGHIGISASTPPSYDTPDLTHERSINSSRQFDDAQLFTHQ